MKNMGFSNWLSPEQVFPEEDDKDSATIKAVRHAYGLLEVNDCEHCKQKGCKIPGKRSYITWSDRLRHASWRGYRAGVTANREDALPGNRRFFYFLFAYSTTLVVYRLS
jgi:hypothetical protein